MLDLGTLIGYVKLDGDGWTNPLEQIGKKTQTFGTNVPLWMGGATAALVAATAAGGIALFGLGSTFDELDDTIRTNTTASGDALAGLEQSARDVAANVPAAFEDIGPAIAGFSTRLGLSGDTLTTVTSQYLEAGRILGQDIDLNTATGALAAFGIEGEDTSAALDTLFQISQATGTNINDLMSKVQAAAPITQQLGFSFEETASMIGVMDRAGLDSGTMIAGMTRGLAKMTEPGESAEDTFKRVTDQIQAFVDSGDEASARDLAGQVFGTRGAAGFVGALSSGKIKMDELVESVGMSGDTILGVADDTQDFGERWDKFVNRMMLALEPIASQVFTALGDGMEQVSAIAGPAFEWLADNPVLLEILAAAVAVLTIGFIALTVATWAMNTALLANPITWIVLAVIALVAAIVLLIMNWDTVVKFLGDTWAGFVGWFTGVMDGFLGWWDGVWQGFVGFVTDTWNGFVSWILAAASAYVGFWMAIFNGIATWWNGLWAGIVGFVVDAWNNVVAFLNGIPAAVLAVMAAAGSWLIKTGGDIVGGLLKGIQNGYTGFMAFIQGIPKAVLGFFSGIGTWLYNSGRDLINGLLKGISSLAGTIGKFFLGLLPSWIVGPFKAALGIASPSKVFAGFGRNIAQGIVVGMDAEQGALDARVRQLVTAPATSSTMGAGGAQGGAGGLQATSSLVIHGNVGWDPEEVARQASERQRQALALAGVRELVPVA